MIKVVHATAGKGVPVSVASGAVRAVLRSNVSWHSQATEQNDSMFSSILFRGQCSL